VNSASGLVARRFDAALFHLAKRQQHRDAGVAIDELLLDEHDEVRLVEIVDRLNDLIERLRSIGRDEEEALAQPDSCGSIPAIIRRHLLASHIVISRKKTQSVRAKHIVAVGRHLRSRRSRENETQEVQEQLCREERGHSAWIVGGRHLDQVDADDVALSCDALQDLQHLVDTETAVARRAGAGAIDGSKPSISMVT
jgi:hypothetical protein